MGIITKMRKQKAVYWKSGDPDGFGGHTWTAPVEIDCRWEDRAELVVMPDGEEKASQSVVYVDRDVYVGDYLRLGSIASAESVSPIGVSGAYPIFQKKYTPKLNLSETLREAFL